MKKSFGVLPTGEQTYLYTISCGGITATVRRTLGGDIDASCGQLRRKYNQSKENP